MNFLLTQFIQNCRLTLLILATVLALHFMGDEVFSLLMFDRAAFLQGQWWRLFTGHFVHTDLNHLFWNACALLILGAWIEFHSRRLFIGSVAVGILLVSLLLLADSPGIHRYCGLSGVLNALVITGLWLYSCYRPGLFVLSAASVYLLKNIYESTAGQALISNTAWPGYTPAHWAGLAAGLLVLAYFRSSPARLLSGPRDFI